MTTPEQRAKLIDISRRFCTRKHSKHSSYNELTPLAFSIEDLCSDIEYLEARVKAAEALADACAFEDYSEMRMNKALAAFQATAVRTGDHAPVQWAGPNTAKPSGDVGSVGAGC